MKLKEDQCILFLKNPSLMINNHFTRYLFAGVINTVIGYLVFLISVNALGLHVYISNLLGYIIGLTCSYNLNVNFVFNIKNKTKQRFYVFIVSFVVCFLLNQLVLFLSTQYFNIYFAQITAMFSYTLSFYALNKYFIFKQ